MNENSSIVAISDLTEKNIGQRIYLMGDHKSEIQGELFSLYPHPSWPETFCLVVSGTMSGAPWEVFLELPAGKNVIVYED